MAGACHLTSLKGVNSVSDVAKDVHQKAYGPFGESLELPVQIKSLPFVWSGTEAANRLNVGLG